MEINHNSAHQAIIWENYPFRMFGTKHTLCRYEVWIIWLRQIPTRKGTGFDVGTEHFSAISHKCITKLSTRHISHQRHISARASHSLYTDNFTKYDDHASSAIKGYCQEWFPLHADSPYCPAIYGRFLIGKDIPYSNSMRWGDVQGRFLQQQPPFVGINNVKLKKCYW